MRNVWNGIVNWIVALLAASTGAPHPMIATDGPSDLSDPEPNER